MAACKDAGKFVRLLANQLLDANGEAFMTTQYSYTLYICVCNLQFRARVSLILTRGLFHVREEDNKDIFLFNEKPVSLRNNPLLWMIRTGSRDICPCDQKKKEKKKNPFSLIAH